MRPRDARYNAIPLPEAPTVDATVAYVAMRSPISDPFARFQNAERLKRAPMMQNHTTFFKPWETIHESNPQEILERKRGVSLSADAASCREHSTTTCCRLCRRSSRPTYKAAGGDCQYQLFEGCEHEWVAQPGPQTDGRARWSRRSSPAN